MKNPSRLVAIASLALLLPTADTAQAAGSAPRTSRPFAEKAAGLRLPLAERAQPLPLRRAVLPKDQVELAAREGYRRDRLVVKFEDGLRVRLRDGELEELLGRALPGVAEARALAGVTGIERLFARTEAELDADRAYASARSGLALADLNHYYLVNLGPGADAGAVAAAWLALPVVETAYFEGIPTDACTDDLPTTPSFIANQDYLEPAPVGVNAFDAWAFHPSAVGVSDYWLIDIEQGWNVNHEDFGEVAVLNGNSSPSNDHGTAVLGEMIGCPGPFGVTGISHGVTARMVNWNNESSIAAAFDRAASFLDPGEIYLIEIHMPGPDSGLPCTCNCGQFEYVPMEWEQANFDAIQTHVAAGIIVVEAGGNGSMNLDSPWYNGLFNRSIRDSGAILVGAGTPGAHAPECWTNSGTRIDCQGYGSSVATTGYGGLFNPETNQRYTGTFSGTSSASPIVTGCAAVVQNLSQQMFGQTLDPLVVRSVLAAYGTPQGAPLNRPIGKLPDLKLALDTIFRVVITHTPLIDTVDEVNPYPVLATVIPAMIPESINGVTVHYSVSGAPYAAQALSPTANPNEWQGAIPAQLAGTYVSYYLAADAANGPDTFFPAGGAGTPIVFIVGTMVPVVVDELEAPSGWTAGAPGDDATSGIWVRGDPFGTISGPLVIAPEDDHTPAPGVQAFVTGNPGPGAPASSGDVDAGRTTLLSPVFDLSSQTYLRFSAWLWSRQPGDDFLRIDLSNDAGFTWHPVAAVNHDLPSWQFLKREIRREDVPFTNAMQLRFVASDYGIQSLVEAGVDDLVIEGLQSGSLGLAQGSQVAPVPAGIAVSPNPFTEKTRITMSGHENLVRLKVYDVEGRLVRILADGVAVPGILEWDGRNGAGRSVAPGTYWLRLEAAGGGTAAARLVKVP
jgi:serine protease